MKKEKIMKEISKKQWQKFNSIMDEIDFVKEWISNAIVIEPQLPEMESKLKQLEEELAEFKATLSN
tara:strand:- start:868 stop:1065 length:198 start_codon:yes stop_codon:yes gene_type:complete